MSAVPGLKLAIKEYESDKVKERAAGGEKIREIFGNRENLLTFQESASREGGAGWTVLFQCLFQAVIVEKKAVIKRNATAQADKRLADAVSLIRWMAERSVHYLSRRPLQALVRHMTALLVHASTIFPPTVRDYAKALRTLLSYPPHLENLDERDWKKLMSLCWARALGDRVMGEEQWEDEGQDELDESQQNEEGDDEMIGTPSLGPGKPKAVITQTATELLTLIPILLSSPSAPILPPFPTKDSPSPAPHSVGYSLLTKVSRFLEQRPTETSGHIAVLRSCNITLVELELNSRTELVQAGTKLLPALINLWSTRNKVLREQILIALRLLLPWLRHASVGIQTREVVQDGLSRLADSIAKESAARWGIEALDLQSLRITFEVKDEGQGFCLGHIQPGFDFTHEMAFAWAVLQLYGDAVTYLQPGGGLEEASSTGHSTARSSKRRKVEEPLHALLTGVSTGSISNRLLHLQVLLFIVIKHPEKINIGNQGLIRSTVLDGLESDDEAFQSWSLLCLASIQTSFGLGMDVTRVWASAMRKVTLSAVSRAACFCASVLLKSGVLGSDVTTKDIGNLLRQIDIQGPPHPYDSTCHFLSNILEIAQSDVRLYSQNMEDKVIAWLERHDLVDGPRGRSRMDGRAPTDVLQLLSTIVGLTRTSSDSATAPSLPECPIVERIIEELRTRPVRLFVLHGEFPKQKSDSKQSSRPNIATQIASLPMSSATLQSGQPALTFLSERQLRLSTWISRQIQSDMADRKSQGTTQAAKSLERLRKSLDLAVLAILFQTSLKIDDIRPDMDALCLIKEYLGLLRPDVINASQTSVQLFTWQAFQPLLPDPLPDQTVWPISLRASAESGIRSELLPASVDMQELEESRSRAESFLVAAWNLPKVAGALRELVDVACRLSDAGSTALTAPNGSLGTPQHGMEEDDFGEIRVAETDAMPVSKEALDSQRTATSFLRIIVTFRLAGMRYLSPTQVITKDLNLLNAFLSADGIRMLQLGQIVCEAVLNEQLRLTDGAIELIIGLLEELLSTYAYAKDEGLYLLVISFLRCSAPIWLLPEKVNDEIAERSMVIAQHVVKKMLLGQLRSWRVRLHILLFLDDYLDYEPDFTLWTKYENDTDDEGKITPPTAITTAMVDRDLRVRVRAATSTAGLFYLPALPSELHQDFYLETMGQQPRQPDVWNAFLTDMLWKLNCCTASSSTRSAALYHLYEVPFSTSAFDLHLQRGLDAVATRLGLSSIQVLWVEYMEVIVPSLLSTHSKTLALAPTLSGYADNKARAVSELSTVGPALLASNTLGYFNELCEAGGTSAAEQALRHILPTTARFLLRLAADKDINDKRLMVELNNNISSIPCGAIKTSDFLAKSSEAIVPFLFDMLQPDSDWSATAEILHKTKSANADHLQMISSVPNVASYTLDSRVPAKDILRALTFLNSSPGFDRKAACFNTLLHLFAQIDRIFLVAEQSRLMSEIVLVISTFADTFKDGRILQLLILEAVSLLDRRDIGQSALQLIEWGFAQIPHSNGQFSRLSDIVARLGRVRSTASEELGIWLDDWAAQEVAGWRKMEILWSSIEQAAILWPDQMKRQLGILPEPSFSDIAELATAGVPSDSMVICQRLSEMISAGDIGSNKEVFAGQSFWQIKDALSEDTWTHQGAQAFVATLAAVDGQIGMTDTVTTVDEDKLFFAKLARNFPNEPVLLVQALLIRHLFTVVDEESRTSRATAYRVLRQLRPTFDDLIKRQLLPKAILSEIELLRSPLPAGFNTPPTFTLDSLKDDVLVSSVTEPEVWLRELSARLCDITSQDQPFFAQLRSLIPAASLRPLLPLLVQAFLSTCGDKKVAQKRQIALQNVLHAVLRNPNTSHMVLHAILESILHLRSYKPPFRNDALGPDFWLPVDFLLLAEAGVKVGSYATALMFLEIAKADVTGSRLDLFDNRVQKIMLAVYSNINDPDGFYGVKTNNIKDALRMRLDHEGEHFRAFGLHGADLEAGSVGASSTSGLIASAHDLHSVGLHRTASSITQSVRNRTEQVAPAQDLFFEIAWRTGDWDLPVPASATSSSPGTFYSALRSLHRSRDYQGVEKAIDVAMKTEMLRLREMGAERMLEIQRTVDNLLALREISQWLGPSVQRALLEGDYNSAALSHYRAIGSSIRYPLAERLHATRMSILDAAQSRESRNLLGDLSSPLNDGLGNLQIQAQLSFSGYARAEGNIQAAINAITAVQHMEGTKMSAACADEYGEVLWAQNEHSLALQLAEGMKKGLDAGSKASGGRYGILTGRIAYWSYRAKLLPVKDASDMFHHAYAQLTAHRTQEEELATLSHDYATFAAEQQAAQRLAPELSALREYRERKAKELSLLQDTGNRRDSRNTKELRVEWQAELDSDAKAITEMEERIDTLTKHALKMFACALKWSDRFDDSVTKMCSLWLAHCDPKGGSTADEAKRAENISRYWASSLDAIPSRKFVFLGPQLAARLHKARTPTTFNSQLNGTVLRLGKEHPYHILYQIIPLAEGEKGSGATPKGRKAVEAAIEGRAGAAADILAVLGADQVHVTARTATKGMILFAQAAMPWCLAPPGNKSDSGRTRTMEVPPNQAIRSLQKVDIPIATCIPVIRPDLDYSSVPKLLRYSTLYTVLGGIHRPKRMKVYDELHKEHHQLFKGEDEIRQDAVMEQVFDMTNKTLAGDRQTKTRNLRFRTYVVIPLAHKTGILEFVAEGVSIGDWLKPAHVLYQKPGEITTSDIREAIRSLQEKDHNDPKIKTTYDEMIPRFPPVMRHFFKEKHKDPMAWFSMRLRYSRSAAVTSMVGWILGIGDRHLSNIMIDQHNGELIHIDFGIVFEAGRNLRIPEKVPFRLTNDMLDGLGITGVDGTFRRCSEQTIRVLRANSDLILTVLEVFKHDPLYAWESEKEKTQRVQGGIRIELNQSSSVLEKADRVLGNIRSKLRDTLSAEYTVNMLVQEARDSENLAKIYHGWHPWF